MKWYKVVTVLVLLVPLLTIPVFGNKPVLIVSGSMEPAIETGALTFVHTCSIDAFGVGDICTYWSDQADEYITHRVTYVGDGFLVTQGDANQMADPYPVLPGSILGKTTVVLNWTAPVFSRYLANNEFDRARMVGDMFTISVAIGVSIYLFSLLVVCIRGLSAVTRGEDLEKYQQDIVKASDAPAFMFDKRYSLYKRLRVYLSYKAFTKSATDVVDEITR